MSYSLDRVPTGRIAYTRDDYHKHAEKDVKHFLAYNVFVASQWPHEFKESESSSKPQENFLANNYNMTTIQKDKIMDEQTLIKNLHILIQRGLSESSEIMEFTLTTLDAMVNEYYEEKAGVTEVKNG